MVATNCCSLSHPALAPPQVRLCDSVGISYRKHIGGPYEGKTLRANPRYGPAQQPVFDNVAVRCAPGGRGDRSGAGRRRGLWGCGAVP